MNYKVESELHANGAKKLYDIYREKRSSGYRCGAHIHSYYEIIYCKQGKMGIRCGETMQRLLSAGEVLVVYPNVVHSTWIPLGAESVETENIVVKFSPVFFYPEHPTASDIRCLLANRTSKDSFVFLDCLDQRRERFISLMEEACREMEEVRIGYELMLRANTACLYALLLRYADFGEGADEGMDDGTVQLAAGALSYIEANYDRPISMNEVARACHVSYSYFSRHFSKWAGMKFNDYLLNFRINKARKLLLQSDTTVTSIAIECGFDNISYFIKKFRQITGVTPNEFRCQYKQI